MASSYSLVVSDFYLISHSLKVISKLLSSKTFEGTEFVLIHAYVNKTYYDMRRFAPVLHHFETEARCNSQMEMAYLYIN